jgi:hypothetical protein
VPLLIARSKQYSETLTPYVARIDAEMQADVLPLTGGLLVHAGFLYAVVRSTLYNSDPATFRVLARRRCRWHRCVGPATSRRTRARGPSTELCKPGWDTALDWARSQKALPPKEIAPPDAFR